MKKLNEKCTYITRNLSPTQFEQLLEAVVKEDGNWSENEKESFRERKWTIKKVKGYWEDFYEEEDTVDALELFNEINRFEYISENGREIVEHGKFEFQLQDKGKTLKVFKDERS